MCCGGELEDLPVKDDVIDFRENRGCCRDLYCLVVFILCVIAMIVIFIVGFSQGNPKILYTPLDSNGGFCGYNSSNKNYTDHPDLPYVVYYNLSTPTQGICVKECPKPEKFCILFNNTITDDNVENCRNRVDSVYYPCRNDPDVCVVVEDTVELINRCIPNVNSALQNLGLYDGLNNVFTGAVNDIKLSWWLFLIAAVFSILLCVLAMCCLRCCARCISWCIIIAAIVMLLILGVILLVFGGKNLGQDLESDEKSGRMFLILGIIILVGVVLCIIILIALRKRISLAATLVQEASTLLSRNYCLLVSPLIYSLIFIGGCVLILVTMVYFFSSLELEDREGETVRFVKMNYQTRGIIVFVVLCFFWLNFFLVGLSQYTIAGVGATYYFSRCPEEEPKYVIARTLKVLFLHHLGSIAVGSFFIALVATFRTFVVFLAHKTKEVENKTLKSCLACLACCLGCMQAAIEFLAERAYIMIALSGKNFWTSAINALKLMVANPVRTTFLTAVSKFLVFMAELFVTAVTVLLCLVILRPDVLGAEKPFLGVMYWWFVAVICAVIAFFIAWIIFQVYEFLIDTVFFCFLFDEHMVGKYGLNYMPYASADLKDFMDGVEKGGDEKPENSLLLPTPQK